MHTTKKGFVKCIENEETKSNFASPEEDHDDHREEVNDELDHSDVHGDNLCELES